MALTSAKKLTELYGADQAVAAITGTTDGTSVNTLVPGDKVVCNLIPFGKTEGGVVGNFVCKIGDREINGRIVKGVQTIGWMTYGGRMLALGSLYKKDAKGNTHPDNVGVPDTTDRQEAVKALNGMHITVGEREDIKVRAFNPGPTDEKEVDGTRHSFVVRKAKKAELTATAAKEEDED